MNKTPPFRALEPTVRERPVAARIIDVDAVFERKHAGVDRWKHLPAEGPREVRVEVCGGALRLLPTDREAARDLMNGRAALGRTYDRQRDDYLFPFDDLARHGVVNLSSFRLTCEIAGINLVIDPAARKLIERSLQTHLRQRRPIPRSVWVDEDAASHEDSDDVTVLNFTRARR